MDDHEIVRNGLKGVFERSGAIRVIGQAGSIGELNDLDVLSIPDVVVLDIQLPDGHGLTAIGTIRTRWNTARIVILSGFADPVARRRAQELGVDGYILKDLDGGEIVEAISRIVAGHQVYYEIGESPVATPAIGTGMAAWRTLGPRERQILDAIGEGKPNKEIAAELNIAEKSVRNIVTSLFLKINVTNRTEAALFRSRLSM